MKKEIRINQDGFTVVGPRDQIEDWLNENYREIGMKYHSHKTQLDGIEASAYKTGESPNKIGFGWVFTINESHPKSPDPTQNTMTVDKIWVALIEKEAWEKEVPII